MGNIKWTYMDHWRADSPRGPVNQYASVKEMDRFVKQISGLGFQGLDTFDFYLPVLAGMFGSLPAFEEFLQERGMEKIVNLFHGAHYDKMNGVPHERDSHQGLFDHCQRVIDGLGDLAIETFIVMPASLYYLAEPVTDDKVKVCAELWNRVGEMTDRYGIRTACHHEFFCGIKTQHELETFYAATDPRYVDMCLDTAQHQIAGLDPVALHAQFADRITAFHFKDCHQVDTRGEYRNFPDSELMSPSTARWFYEMGTAEGLVDFPSLMTQIRDRSFQGWLTVEHDKANIGGDDAESTAISKWYIDHVLSEIYQ
jgi:inosose dehydratase